MYRQHQPRSNESLCMYASSGMGTVSLTTYSNNSTYNDEWNIAKIGYMSETVTLEGQQTDSWCWAATSRMFAKNYGSVPTSRNQSGAVATVFPHLDADERDTVQSGGIYAQATINYFLGEEITWLDNGDINPDCLSTVYHNKLVYSKDVVIDFIDDQQVLYIGRTTVYTNSNIGGYVDYSGHATLIYGYVNIGSETYFLIRDPDPPTNNAAGVAPGTTKLMTYQQIYYHRYLDNNGYEMVCDHTKSGSNTSVECHKREYWTTVIAKKADVSASYVNSTIQISPNFIY